MVFNDTKANFHEIYKGRSADPASSDRGFCLVFACVFALLAGGLFDMTFRVRLGFGIAALGLVMLAIWRPQLAAPLNRVWTAFGRVLARLMSPLILGVLFYGFITPIGCIARRCGAGLSLRYDPQAESYWIPRDPHGRNASNMTNQF